VPSLRIRRVINACTDDERFPRRGRHAYLALMVEGLPEGARRELLQFDIGGFGSNAVYLGPSKFPEDANALQVTVPIPLGLSVGPTTVRMRYENQCAAAWELNLCEGREW
jgi:hypothetical protein